MHYIVLDLEFNQDLESFCGTLEKTIRKPFEIIQIGAIKLDSNFQTITTFNRFVKPTFYQQISPFITELTKVTTAQLETEETFPSVYNDFLTFLDCKEDILIIWGMSDIKELFRNAKYHQLDTSRLPRSYVNLQPYASLHLGYPSSKLLKLSDSVKEYNIPITKPFHDACTDAYYTAELLIKLQHKQLNPQQYDPTYVNPQKRQQKKVIDFYHLIKQFEKMYERPMTKQEQEIIKTAYHMGKTQQFAK